MDPFICDRLSETDIHRLTHDKGFIYNCKRCLNKDDTVVKCVVGGSPVQPTFTNQITMPTIPTNHTEGHRSQAVAIVDDEGDCVCSVCLEIIIGTQNRCSKCLSTCHDSCIDGASDDDDSGICLSCCAKEAQIHQQSVSSQSDDQSRPDQSSPNTTAISCDRSGMQTSSQGSKIAPVCSYLRVPWAVGQVKILILLVKIKFFPIYTNIFCDAG